MRNINLGNGEWGIGNGAWGIGHRELGSSGGEKPGFLRRYCIAAFNFGKNPVSLWVSA
ncbi:MULTISPECIES: hypothetical protein [unclassified Microcoleus]|uniref:hypothetical protein n=1 Tax=unclassified Microcoleus TaxID=2642155 RepID=UPI002FD372A8